MSGEISNNLVEIVIGIIAIIMTAFLGKYRTESTYAQSKIRLIKQLFLDIDAALIDDRLSKEEIKNIRSRFCAIINE